MVVVSACVGNGSNTEPGALAATDPISGTFEYYTGALICTVHFGSDHSFSSDCSLMGDPSGRWIKTDTNQYKVTFTNGGSYTYTYYPDLDQISVPTTTPPTFMYRLGKRPVTTIPTPMEPHPDPIFHKGDVVMSSNADNGGGILIKNYDPATDTYLITWVQKSNDQTWYHGTDPHIFGPDEKWSRTKVDSEYPYKIGSANPDSLSSAPSNAPIHLEGINSDLKKFDTYQSGAYIFTTTYSGNGNFIVWIKDNKGNQIGLAANAIGSYHGAKMMQLYADTYYAEVTANGQWSIDISST